VTKVKLDREQIQILKSWVNPEQPKPVKSWLKPPTVYAYLTRSDPKSGFAQYIDCTLVSTESVITGLQLSEYDQVFNPAMFDLTPTYGTPYSYEMQAMDVKPYQDTSGTVRYDIYHITLVDQPYGLRFTRVLSIGEPTDDPFGDDEDYGEEYPCK
jgi:hypothetical protein